MQYTFRTVKQEGNLIGLQLTKNGADLDGGFIARSATMVAEVTQRIKELRDQDVAAYRAAGGTFTPARSGKRPGLY